MIVLQTTTAQWFSAVRPDGQTPAQFFAALRAKEEGASASGASVWVEVEPLPEITAFGPKLDRAWVKLEHVAVFGLRRPD